MVVDALLQIPWLSAIVSGVLWVGKAVWELIGRTARSVALWFATFVPLVINWIRQTIARRILFFTLLLSFVAPMWLLLGRLFARLVTIALPSEIGPMLGFMGQYVWGEPFCLSVAFDWFMVLWGIHLECLALRIFAVRLGWYMRLGVNKN